MVVVSDLLQGLSVYLVGMMGSGKSTIAQLLAKALGYRCLDTDTLIEQIAQQSITQIFAEQGEAGFRELETQVLEQVAAYTRMAIATGGGIVLKQQNWSYLRQGLVIWLDVPVEVLLARLAEDTTRPLLQDPDPAGKLQTILTQRQSLYALADLHISISESDTPDMITQRIVSMIPSILKAAPEPLN